MNVLDKIKKLLALSKSPNKNEAAAALAKAMEIANAEGIDLKDAEAARENESIGQSRAEKARARVPKWQGILAEGIARLFGCVCVQHFSWRIFDSGKRCELRFAGFPSDLEIVEYVYVYLKRQIIRIAGEHMKGKIFRKRARMEQYKADYLHGMTLGVIRQAEEFYRREHGGEYGLVTHRSAMVKRRLLERGCAEVNCKNAIKRPDAVNAGYHDAGKIALARGVNGGTAGAPPQIKANLLLEG